ncbi:MAG: ATP-binding protein [Desulfitobacteriaceae bacterium]|nr:ATP-binding protein [Desulfitobacteriaceae bacterium]
MSIKKTLHEQSIIQSILLKITFSIFLFLIIFIIIYGKNFWEKESLKSNYQLLSLASQTQSEIQAKIDSVQLLKENQNLNNIKLLSEISQIIKPIINKKANNFVINYYDLDLNVIIENDNSDLKSKAMISVKLPIYSYDELVGYLTVYANNDAYILDSFYEVNEILILILSLAVMIIFFIMRYMKQLEFYLSEYAKMIIESDYEQVQILNKLPELKPILTKINSFTHDLKQVNLELEASKLKISKILQGISDGFFALDSEWKFTFVNYETQKLIGKVNNSLSGKSLWEVFPQIMDSLTYEKMHEAVSLNEALHWEAEGFGIHDQYYEYHAYPFKEGLTVFFRDITEMKRQQQEFGRLERLNLIAQLAAGIGHEIRNPLTTVRGFLQFLGSKTKYDTDKEYMQLMISEIDRANTIITDFLSLAKVNLDDTKPQNINEIINKLFPMLQANAYNNNKEVVLELDILPSIVLSENEMKQLILNLVRNGLEVTPEYGSVKICTYRKEDKVVLAIKDQGSGIPLEIQEKLGTPFFTTKETGTGLGLAISIGIARRHNAIFEFETGNSGTTFNIIFPTIQKEID